MQTLWSRVASRGACRCPQCLHIPFGVTRRATNNAPNTLPRYWTSSTLWLSGTFATAATFDAVAKQHRREQWDAAIAEIKQELDTEGCNQHESKEEESLTLANPLLDAKLDILRFVRPTRAVETWPDSSSLPLEEYRIAPQSIYATSQRKSDTSHRRWTPKKLETMMLSMDALQLTILLDLNVRSLVTEAVAAVPEKYAKVMQMPREQLRDMQQSKLAQLKHIQRNLGADLGKGYQRPVNDISLCRYREDQNGDYQKVATDLNSALQGLFDAYFGQAISKSVLLARLAYNLFLSTAAPNIDTYNTLLLGFAKTHPYLVKATIQSLNSTRMRSNEVTDETMLRFYTKTNERKLFIKYFETMRGKHGGQCLARPDIVVNAAGRSRLVVSDQQPHKIIQLPYPTPMVFAAVVEGLLNFGRFDTALTVCKQMESEGWGICIRGLYPLLHHCVEQRNWKAGLAVWKQVQTLQQQSSQINAPEQGSLRLQIYGLMLRLCRQSEQQETYNQIWLEATQHRRMPPQSLIDIIGPTRDEEIIQISNKEVIDQVPAVSSQGKISPVVATEVEQPQIAESQTQLAPKLEATAQRATKKIGRPQTVISKHSSLSHLWGSHVTSWHQDARAG